MKNEGFTLLLIQPPGAERNRFLSMAEPLRGFGADLLVADNFESGRAQLYQKPVDLVVVDTHLPDVSGLQAINNMAIIAPQAPVLALDTKDMTDMAEEALTYGAQDWLQLSTLTPEILTRAIRYAFERHRLRQALDAMSMLDSTGLYNLKGFELLANQQMAWAQRQNRPCLLFYSELTNLDQIGQQRGDHEKGNALTHFGRHWGLNFRRSDIVARIGPVSFVAFVLDAGLEHEDLIRNRLMARIAKAHQSEAWPFCLDITLGSVFSGALSLEELSLDAMVQKAKILASDYKGL